MDLSGLGYGPVVGLCEDDNEPSDPEKAGKSWTRRETVRFSRMTVIDALSFRDEICGRVDSHVFTSCVYFIMRLVERT